MYNDILYYGSETEKTVQAFKMLDLTNGSPGIVTEERFLEFMQKYTLCRAELLQTKFKITDQMMLHFIDQFHEIAGDEDQFSLTEFIQAKIVNPKLLSILEDFDQSMKHETNLIDFLQLKHYHDMAITELHQTREMIKKSLGPYE